MQAECEIYLKLSSLSYNAYTGFRNLTYTDLKWACTNSKIVSVFNLLWWTVTLESKVWPILLLGSKHIYNISDFALCWPKLASPLHHKLAQTMVLVSKSATWSVNLRGIHDQSPEEVSPCDVVQGILFRINGSSHNFCIHMLCQDIKEASKKHKTDKMFTYCSSTRNIDSHFNHTTLVHSPLAVHMCIICTLFFTNATSIFSKVLGLQPCINAKTPHMTLKLLIPGHW